MTSVDWDEIYSNLKPSEPPEKINAYKICILLMVRDYVGMVHSERHNSSNEQRIMASTFLKLVQRTNVSFETLLKVIKARFPDGFQTLFCDSIFLIATDFNWFLSFLKDSKNHIFDTVDRDNKSIVEKFSFVGHFVRKIWLTTEKSSYTELTLFWCQLKSYLNDISNVEELYKRINDIPVETNPVLADLDDNSLDVDFNGSRKDLKRLLHRQISLLQTNHSHSPPHASVAHWINQIKKTYPDCYDLFFLKLLNDIRAGDFVGAESALHEYFDCSAVELGKDKPEGAQFGWSKSLRYGPFLLAKLNSDFGHRDAALAHLQECIVKAQESNDNECLQYALAEYCHLIEHDCVDSTLQNLYNISLKGSRDLNLQNIFEKTQLCQVLADFRNGKTVVKSIEALQIEASDNGGRLSEALYPVVLSSLYLAHGLVEQSALEAQKFLCSRRFDPSSPDIEQISESHCVALCNLAFCEFIKGNIVEAKEILKKANNLFSLERNFDHLILCEASMCCLESMYKCEFDECSRFLSQIGAVSTEEAVLRFSEVFLKMVLGKTEAIVSELKILLKSTRSSHFRCRIFLTLTDYYIAIEQNVGLALYYANECKTLSVTCEYKHFYSMIQRRFALVSIMADDIKSAWNILSHNEKMTEMFVDQIEIGKFYLTKAKCLALMVKDFEIKIVDDEVLERYHQIETSLLKAVKIFQRCGCLYLEKETSYTLAIFFNERKLNEERNKWSKRFKDLDIKIIGHFPVLLL